MSLAGLLQWLSRPKRSITFWYPAIDPSQPEQPPDAMAAMRDLNPAPGCLSSATAAPALPGVYFDVRTLIC